MLLHLSLQPPTRPLQIWRVKAWAQCLCVRRSSRSRTCFFADGVRLFKTSALGTQRHVGGAAVIGSGQPKGQMLKAVVLPDPAQ